MTYKEVHELRERCKLTMEIPDEAFFSKLIDALTVLLNLMKAADQ